VDDLNKQKESVAAHLAQISQLLGTQMSGLGSALKPSGPPPAVSSSPAKAVTAAPANGGTQPAPAAASDRQGGQTPSGQGSGGRSGNAPAPKQPASAKSAKSGDDDEWWTN